MNMASEPSASNKSVSRLHVQPVLLTQLWRYVALIAFQIIVLYVPQSRNSHDRTLQSAEFAISWLYVKKTRSCWNPLIIGVFFEISLISCISVNTSSTFLISIAIREFPLTLMSHNNRTIPVVFSDPFWFSSLSCLQSDIYIFEV